MNMNNLSLVNSPPLLMHRNISESSTSTEPSEIVSHKPTMYSSATHHVSPISSPITSSACQDQNSSDHMKPSILESRMVKPQHVEDGTEASVPRTHVDSSTSVSTAWGGIK